MTCRSDNRQSESSSCAVSGRLPLHCVMGNDTSKAVRGQRTLLQPALTPWHRPSSRLHLHPHCQSALTQRGFSLSLYQFLKFVNLHWYSVSRCLSSREGASSLCWFIIFPCDNILYKYFSFKLYVVLDILLLFCF